jgi:Fe-S oxidoreductase
MINGTDVRGGWRSPEVHEALDLCLSCKGCASDCPTGVDMASYKAEVLHQSYRRRIRPASHYSLGWLPRWAKLASVAPKLANAAMGVPLVGPAALAVAGVDRRRNIPPFAPKTFRSWFAANVSNSDSSAAPGDEVVLFVDSFTNYFSPEVGVATVRVLQAAGYRPTLTAKQQCCGLTWISTGQLDTARRILGKTVATLAASADRGVPVVGMEPSCTAVLRSEAVELVGGAQAEQVSKATRTLAELLTERGWEPPSLAGEKVVAQPHCHHHSVMSWSPDAQLLRTAGAELDGYSCRTQLEDLSDRRGIHLAQLLADRLP